MNKIILVSLIFIAIANAAREDLPTMDGQKHVIFSLGQLFLIKTPSPPATEPQAQLIDASIMNQPPKALRLPIPKIESQSTVSGSERKPERDIDYYDLVRDDEEKRQNERAQVNQISNNTQSIVIDPQHRFLGADQNVAAMIPDGQGGFMPVDNIEGPVFLPEVPEEDVLFVVNSRSDDVADSRPSSQPTDFDSISLNPNANEQNANGNVEVNASVTQLNQENEAVNEDESNVKGMIDAKQSFQKKVKPAFKAINELPSDSEVKENQNTEKPVAVLETKTEPIEAKNHLEKIISSETNNPKTEAVPKEINATPTSKIKTIDSETDAKNMFIVDSDLLSESKSSQTSQPQLTQATQDQTLSATENTASNEKNSEAPVLINSDIKPSVMLPFNVARLDRPVFATRFFFE